MINWDVYLVLFCLIIFSILILYLDLKYKKVPNNIAFVSIFIVIFLGFYLGFIQKYLIEFIVRFLILLIVFYFLYLQWRVAGGDFKIYIIFSTLAMYFVYVVWNYKINWLYFDLYLIIYSLIIWFIYLFFRYIVLFLYNLVKRERLILDDMIKIKFWYDFKDAYLHYQILVRILFYVLFVFLAKKFFENNTIISFLIIIFEFLFFWYFFYFLKNKIYIPLRRFFRKKQFKWLVYFAILLFCYYSFKNWYYSLVLLVFLFSFAEYIVSFFQINFDAYIKPVEEVNFWEKLSFRNFWIDFYKWSLLEEIEVNKKVKERLIRNWKKYVELIDSLPYWVFIIFWVWYFVIKFLFF